MRLSVVEAKVDSVTVTVGKVVVELSLVRVTVVLINGAVVVAEVVVLVKGSVTVEEVVVATVVVGVVVAIVVSVTVGGKVDAVVDVTVVGAAVDDVVVTAIVVVVGEVAVVVETGHALHCTCAGTARSGSGTHWPAPPKRPLYAVKFNLLLETGSKKHRPSHPPAHVNTSKLNRTVLLQANFRKKELFANCVQ